MRSDSPAAKALRYGPYGQSSVLTVHKNLAYALGDIKAALLLEQIIFWSEKKPEDNGWFYKTYEDWTEEILLSKKEVSHACALLRSENLIETVVRQVGGVPKKLRPFVA